MKDYEIGKDIEIMSREIIGDIAECCALCEHSMKLEFRRQYLCKYKNRLSEVDPEERCKHFEIDLLKLSPKPRRSVKFEF